MLFLMDSNGKTPEVDVKNHPLMERIVEILRELRKIKKLEEELDQEIEKLAESVKNNDHLRYEFGNYLYWKSDSIDHGKLKILFKICAVNESRSDGRSIKPLLKKFQCIQCREYKVQEILSRADLKRFKPEHYCDECDAKRPIKRVGFIKVKISEEEAEELKKENERKESLKTMPYKEYLQTPEWKATAQAARKRAGFRCQMCKANGVLEVHHNNYERRGRELPSDLIVLCDDCHEVFHEKRKLKKQ